MVFSSTLANPSLKTPIPSARLSAIVLFVIRAVPLSLTLVEHAVVLDQRHLIRLVHSYLTYYHDDRVHLGLNKDTPNKRPVTPRRSPTATVVALPRGGGLHHRYEWREAA